MKLLVKNGLLLEINESRYLQTTKSTRISKKVHSYGRKIGKKNKSKISPTEITLEEKHFTLNS